MANIKLGGTVVASESSGTVTLAGTIGSGVTFPSGHILQVQSTIITSTSISMSADQTWEDVPGLSIALTPLEADSDFWVQAICSMGGQANFEGVFKVLRKRNANAWEDDLKGDSNGSAERATAPGFYDTQNAGDCIQRTISLVDKNKSYTVGTDAMQYKIQWWTWGSDVYLNRTPNSGGENSTGLTSLIVAELKG